MLLRPNPALERYAFDSGARDPQILCEVPVPDRSRTRRYSVPVHVVNLLDSFDGIASADEVIARYRIRHPHVWSDAELRRLVYGVLLPNGFLVDSQTLVASDTGREKQAGMYLQLKLRILPVSVVRPVARVLSMAFAPGAALISLMLIAAAHVLVYGWLAPQFDWDPGHVANTQGGALILLGAAAAVLHEFGHAAAAYRFGCRNSEIGIGQYLHLTVLYTDLSETWRLPRRQRAVVDLGGIYFQTLFAVMLLALYARTGWQLPVAMFILNDLAVLAALNPFLRLDGYWLLSDLSGIANLRERSERYLRDLWLRLRGRAAGPAMMGPHGTVVLALYAVFSCVFFAYIAHMVLIQVGPSLLRAYPGVLLRLWQAIPAAGAAPGELAGALFAAVWRGCVLYGMGRFVYRLILRNGARGLWYLARRPWSGRREVVASAAPANH